MFRHCYNKTVFDAIRNCIAPLTNHGKEQNALRAYLFSVICLGNCFLVRFATLLGETLESAQFPMT